jgi:hypothetical protein
MYALMALTLVAGATLLAACGGGGSKPTATATAVPPTATAVPPTATAVPPTPEGTTYSSVLATYPAGTQLCATKADLSAVDASGGLSLTSVSALSMVNGTMTAKCYGTKLTVVTVGNQPVTLEGKTYEPWAKLTVDKDLHWIEVSSWN